MSWLDVELLTPFLEGRHLILAAEAESWARNHLATLAEPADDDLGRRQARTILSLAGAAGWLRWIVPETYGGEVGAPDLRALCLLRECFAAASPLADAVLALQALGSAPIALGGDSVLLKRYLPLVARGEAMAAFAMTEPGAGSDVAAIAATARRDGEDWVLDGHKWFISNAGIADFYCVFVRTGPDPGSRGITCFVVDADNPGLRFVRAQALSSPHPLGEIAFEACRVSDACRLAAVGDGFKLGMRSLDLLRPTVAAAACGMAARALDEALIHARERHQFGKPLADFQLVQQKLARTATELAAARLLTYHAARAADHGAARITREAAMAKLFATEAAQRAVDDAVQVLGGRGALAESAVDRLYRSVRALRIYEGTSEVQHLVIARELMRT